MDEGLKHNTTVAPTVTFVMEHAFEPALKKLRHAFARDRLEVVGELDPARRVRTALNLNVSPCRILLVDNALFLLDATAIDRTAAVFIPLHVVVSGNGACTLIHVLGLASTQLAGISIGARTALTGLLRQLLCVLDEIAQRRAGEATDRGEGRAEKIDVA